MFAKSRKTAAAVTGAAAAALMRTLTSCSGRGQSAESPAARGGDSCMDSIKSSGVLTIGNPGYLPIASLDGEEFTGLIPDLLTAANAKIGLEDVTLEPVTLDFSGLVPALVSDRIVVSGDTMTPTDERKKEIGFTDNVFYITQDLLVQKGNPKDLHSVEDLVGHTATTYEGSTWIPDLTEVPGIDVRPLKTSSAIFQGVESGQIDAGLIDSVAVAWALKTNPELNLEAATDYENPDGKTPTALGISPNCSDYSDAVNGAFGEMKESGEYQEILAAWGLTPAEKYLNE